MSTLPVCAERVAEEVLHVADLGVRFRTRRGVVPALAGLSFDLAPGGTRVVIGESGSGKSVLAHTLLGLLPRNAEVLGAVRLAARHLVGASARELRELRARHVGFVPQSPATSLNPVRRLDSLLTELARVKGIPAEQAPERVDAALRELDLSLDAVARRYPHQLSGGMQQRVLIAAAKLGHPALVVADEPTSALDADLAADTADGLVSLAEHGTAVLVITHDLRLAERLGGDTAVLYAGHLVEDRPTSAVFDAPAHPYTQGLLAALPERGGVPIPGMPPELTDLPPGCPFAPRCERHQLACDDAVPRPVAVRGGYVRCLDHAHR
ncbi:ABC transporter ATP-binding protein [Egibacter rhizosphaerae]|uniref:ABC transporter ATP-binding protein n=1 Tax=Egibacter rhizosphaerae TaxID=1670831 RepID=UPI0013F145B0|nr:ABC transporter ATP-binding protein [Egibacter rhizosphaerae]